MDLENQLLLLKLIKLNSNIQITDNAIIPLKERVGDRYYEPYLRLYNRIFKKNK